MSFFSILKKYKWWVIAVSVFGIAANGLAVYVPRYSGSIIDSSVSKSGVVNVVMANSGIKGLMILVISTFVIAIIQICISTYFSEKVGKDLRLELVEKIGDQTYDYVSTSTPGRLMTVMTSDVSAVQDVMSQGLVVMLGAFITLGGSIISLLTLNFKIGLYTISVIPLLIIAFAVIFRNLGGMFRKRQETVEKINAVINESIIGSALVRVLNSSKDEEVKFNTSNTLSKNVGLSIVNGIASLIPVVTLLANASIIIILWFGGHAVVGGSMTLGQLSAFLSYSLLFIWPLFVLSFVGTQISSGVISLKRISDVTNAPVVKSNGTFKGDIVGDIEFKNVSLVYTNDKGDQVNVLKNISFKIHAKTKNAIVGPTGAGKTQIFYLIAGLVRPTSGEIYIDGRPISEFDPDVLVSHMGLVFQDSILFNVSLRENISFAATASAEGDNEESINKAIDTAELRGLVNELGAKGLDTNVSERGTSLSGGQKQRVMLARALTVSPKVLLLDDFTARVDRATEAQILHNVEKNYPDLTLVSITQKVETITHYDQIIVVMEGEMLAQGTHDELSKKSFEYQQIIESQKTTNTVSSDDAK
ncbi:MAG: ABC transporter ATP-binding protein [bacterium]